MSPPPLGEPQEKEKIAVKQKLEKVTYSTVVIGFDLQGCAFLVCIL